VVSAFELEDAAAIRECRIVGDIEMQAAVATGWCGTEGFSVHSEASKYSCRLLYQKLFVLVESTTSVVLYFLPGTH
jgi:hypothetical protein